MKTRKTRDRQIRYLSQAAQLEEASNPAIIHTTMILISAALLAFMCWAAMTNINEMAHTPGEIIPAGHEQIVQHLEGGIVTAIPVRDGDMVEQNQIILTLDGAGSQDDLTRAKLKQISLRMQEERFRAFSEGREPDFSNYAAEYPDLVKDQNMFFDGMVNARAEEQKVIREQIEQRKRMVGALQADLQTAAGNHAITKDLYSRRKELNEKGYASDVQFLETQQSMNEIEGQMRQTRHRISVTQAEIREFENRLKSLDARHRDETHERLDAVMSEAAQNAEYIQKLEARVGRLEVRAPATGIVKGLSVNTIGAVVQPGQTLMEIVPIDNNLIVEVKIPPQHIGHIRPGQPVQVKFSSFDFSRYGFVSGKLKQISATTFTGEAGERYYQGLVEMDQNFVGNDPANTIMPGMTVMADIITGEKTILDYLLKPIHNSMKTAFTER